MSLQKKVEIKKRAKVFTAFCFFLLAFSGCEREMPNVLIPLVPVDYTINLTLQEYIPLLQIGGYVYENREGYKGIIIYRETNDRFIAIERACSYQPRIACEIVKVDDSGLFLIDECCGSTFDFGGNPTGKPSNQPLLLYHTYLDGNFLTIRNTL